MVQLILIGVVLTQAGAPTAPGPTDPSPTNKEHIAVYAVSAPGAGDASVAGRVEIDFSDALRRQNLDVANLEALFPPTAQASSHADGLFQEGKDAYDNIDFEGAIEKLTGAAVYSIKHPELVEPSRLANIFLMLGAAQYQNGSKEEAAKGFALAYQLFPATTLDPKFFDASVTKAALAAKQAVEAKPKVAVSITTEPGGATVEMAGQPWGRTPIDSLRLTAGRHFVRLSRPGYEPLSFFVEVGDKAPPKIAKTLKATPGFAAIQPTLTSCTTAEALEQPVVPGATAELSKTLGARFLALLTITKPVEAAALRAEVQVWNTSTGQKLRGIRFPVGRADEMDEAAALIEQWVHAGPPLAPLATGQDLRPTGGTSTVTSGASALAGSPVYKKWWFWVAVGGAAAAVTTAAVVAASPPNRPFSPVFGFR